MEFKKSQLWCKIAPKPVVQMTCDQAKVISFEKWYNLGNFGEYFSRMMPPTETNPWWRSSRSYNAKVYMHGEWTKMSTCKRCKM